MIRSILLAAVILVLLGAGGALLLSAPRPLAVSDVPEHRPDLANGERLFWAGGCASCHAAPGAKEEAKLTLADGVELHTPFGTFRSPNISPHEETGIGGWSTLDFINAMNRGVSPEGEHYYPAFPYTNYQRMPLVDLIDLKGFLDTLPNSANRVADHDLGFPFNLRRPLGFWKLLYARGEPFAIETTREGASERGRYLVEGPGHCGACHTPRDPLGGPIEKRHMAGAVAFEGDPTKKPGAIPNITPHEDGIGGWTARDIAYALETGMNPDFDTFGSSMVSVQENMARLTPEDRAAIAGYLKNLTPLPSKP